MTEAPAEPVFLRHRDATRQAITYLVFGDLLLVFTVVAAVLFDGPGKALAIIPAVGMVPFMYAGIRLLTLKVRIDEQGVWEPDPFRLTYVTPWSDLKRAERVSTGKRVALVGVRIVHANGETHNVEALMMQAGIASAEPIVEGWIKAINDAKVTYRS